VKAQHIREYVYLFAAVDPFTGEFSSLIYPEANAESMSAFLKIVATEFPTDHILMVLDGAGFHRADDLDIPKSIRLQFLPPYCPELNCAEHVWEELREKEFANRAFGHIDPMIEQLRSGTKRAHEDRDRIRSLCGFHWIINI